MSHDSNPFLKRFARELRSLRDLRNLTQQDVAQGIGVRQGTVSDWENGYAKPRPTKRAAIARFFEIDLAKIEEWLSDPFPDPGVDEAALMLHDRLTTRSERDQRNLALLFLRFLDEVDKTA